MSATSRRALVASVSALVLGLAPLSTATAAPSPSTDAAFAADRSARQAAAFQAGELVRNRIPSGYVDGPDWGLTVDTIYMLAATGGKDRKVRAMGRVLARQADAYTSSSFGDATYESAGATAKVLLAAKVLGRPVRDFGGTDYRRALLSFQKGSGRLADRNSDGTDYSNTISQSLGVIGLSRSGRAPQPTVRFLLRQQCAAGFFTLTIAGGKTCQKAGGTASVDATALAVQAMLAAKKQGHANVPARRITRAVRWLVRAQRGNGSFGSDADIRTSNANSTGLAAQALADAGRRGPVRQAGAWVRTLQVTKRHAGAAGDAVGALAYDRATLRTARRDGLADGPTRDRFRRATASGAFALAPRPLRTLTLR